MWIGFGSVFVGFESVLGRLVNVLGCFGASAKLRSGADVGRFWVGLGRF